MEKDDNYTLYGFSCSWCKYKCVRRNDMQKHMQTKKHKKNVEEMESMGIMKINHSLLFYIFFMILTTLIIIPIKFILHFYVTYIVIPIYSIT